NSEGEVELVLGLEPLLLVLGQHRVGQLERVLGGQDLGHRAVGDVTVDAQLRPFTRGDVEVGRLLLDHLLEQRPQIEAHPAVSLTTSSRVVIPRSTFLIPSMRNVSMPSTTACS